MAHFFLDPPSPRLHSLRRGTLFLSGLGGRIGQKALTLYPESGHGSVDLHIQLCQKPAASDKSLSRSQKFILGKRSGK